VALLPALASRGLSRSRLLPICCLPCSASYMLVRLLLVMRAAALDRIMFLGAGRLELWGQRLVAAGSALLGAAHDCPIVAVAASADIISSADNVVIPAARHTLDAVQGVLTSAVAASADSACRGAARAASSAAVAALADSTGGASVASLPPACHGPCAAQRPPTPHSCLGRRGGWLRVRWH
jgi:hypothetical protein